MTLARYDEDMMPVPAPARAIQRDDFGASQLQRLGETSAVAVAAKEKALVEARYVMAERHPRDWDVFRQDLLKSCRRPRFAEKAIYSKPTGDGKVEGFSIRFVEAALQMMGNVMPQSVLIYQDEHVMIYNVSVTDLERNVAYQVDVAVEKTVERSRVGDGRTVLRQRSNSQGKTTYTLVALEEEMLNKVNSLISKAIRTLGLRLIPYDIREEAEDLCRRMRRSNDAADPDAAKKRLIDSFAELHISVSSLKTYVGHDLASLSPAELDELRSAFQAIRDKEATWQEFLDQREADRGNKQQPDAGPKPDGLKEKLAQKAAAVRQSQPDAYDEEGDLAAADAQMAAEAEADAAERRAEFQQQPTTSRAVTRNGGNLRAARGL